MTSLPFPIAEDPDDAAREAARKLFAGDVGFLKGVVAMDGLPPDDRAEVCFAGRSNVGKSSLINALTGRKGLARASNTPGRTQEINYFTLSDSHYLVDLPGYGYANAPLAVDEEIMTLLDRAAVTFQVVLTKADKVKPSERARILDQVRARLASHPAAYPELVVTSSEKGDGLATLKAIIAGLA